MAEDEAEDQPTKKARKTENSFLLSFDFSSTDSLDSILYWKNPPASCTLENGAGMKIIPKRQTDFWRKSFRTPPVDSATGHALLYGVPEGVQRCIAQTTFTLKGSNQYDQAGIMVYIDDQHWLKAGIEVEGGVANMSCVITNGESDWNYKVWPTMQDIHIRVEIKWYSGLCECIVEHMEEGGGDTGNWCFLREAPIGLPGDERVKVGIMCCAPKESNGEGTEAIFKSLTIQGEYSP